MKVGDLVKYDSTNDLFQWDGEIGIIIEFKNTFCSGGGGAWPSSERHAIVSWSGPQGTWVTNEREEDLEVINEDR